MIRRVQGIEFDGSCVTFTWGRMVAEVGSIDYSDDITTATGTSLGSQEQRYRTAGLYKTGQVTVEFRASVYRRDVLPFLGNNGFTAQQQPIIIGYTHPQLGKDSDMLKGARMVGMATKSEAGEKALMIPVKFDIDQIFWGDSRHTLNRVSGFPQLG